MKVLVACEESQAVCKAFRARGHEAYSCDIQPCSGGHPEWHIQEDAIETLRGGQYDMLIAHPPCTYLSYAGEWAFNVGKYGDKALQRWNNRIEAMRFFMAMMEAPVEYICVENPKGFPMGYYRPADQIIQPYYFGDSAMKTTCLWLKGLPQLIYSKGDLFSNQTMIAPPEPTYTDKSGKARYFTDAITGSRADTQKERSKTFPGIANAMAEQWGSLVPNKKAA